MDFSVRYLLMAHITVSSVIWTIIYKLIISESIDKLLMLFSRKVLEEFSDFRNIIPRYWEAIEIYINELWEIIISYYSDIQLSWCWYH